MQQTLIEEVAPPKKMKKVFVLTKDNYFSNKANWLYMSNSQYKSFVDCEARTMAELQGLWPEEKLAMDPDYFIVGKYVHYWNEGALDKYKASPEFYYDKKVKAKVKGEKDTIEKVLYANVAKCFAMGDKIIEVIKADKLFMMALSGQKEIICTAHYLGVYWKILIDSYFPDKKRFGDLKILKALSDKFWVDDHYENVFEYRGYFVQLAIYAEIERLFNARKHGDYFEPFIAIATKGKYPDKEIVSFSSNEENYHDFIRRELIEVEKNMPRIKEVKAGNLKPNRCGGCEYCLKTKVLTGTKHYSAFNLY